MSLTVTWMWVSEKHESDVNIKFHLGFLLLVFSFSQPTLKTYPAFLTALWTLLKSSQDDCVVTPPLDSPIDCDCWVTVTWWHPACSNHKRDNFPQDKHHRVFVKRVPKMTFWSLSQRKVFVLAFSQLMPHEEYSLCGMNCQEQGQIP